MTLIEIARKLARDAELDQKKADAIVQAVAEYTEGLAPVSKEHFDARFQTFSEHFDGQLRLVREHFEAELRVLRAEMEKRFAEMGERIADLRTDMEKGLRDQTWRLAGSFILVVLIATVIQHYWR